MTFDADLKTAQAQLTRWLEEAHCAVAFTGAGISTECGIPDFRSPGGLWTKNKPIPFDAFLAMKDARNEAWRRKFAMEEAFAGARPGRGHMALARLLEQGRLGGVITQNIDGLHQASGIPDADLIELHGNGTYATCLECGTRFELDWVKERFDTAGGIAPDCPHCGGPIKAATISFGQAMPEKEMRRADALTRESDLFIVLGSSLVVFPAAQFPLQAKDNGARLVIVNREPTEFDGLADMAVHADIGDVLAPFAQNA
ncbi:MULTISPECIES: Sir2 family NAD-dependent protein deacetylase [unclassified Xanthobacter]|uniref:SIR2 family NAD-dependent protein deacylase n=1 Tax=unclassified Xanthobacter TaxID=2623496 RepID=UPI001F47DD87|nr:MULTISPECIES: Sir2 family NAD-dependent protein deacetylase [unclassified Xanthobacter]